MATFVALLRGINVGRGPRIGMAELREVAAGLGWTGPRTHLQSGNLVFDVDAGHPAELAAALEAAVAARFPVQPRVVVLTCTELAAIAAATPFAEQAAAAPTTVHAVVLSGPVGPEAAARVAAAAQRASARRRQGGGGATDRAVLVGRTVHLLTPDGAGRSELAAALGLPGGLGADVVATARNWSTVRALVDLCGEQPRRRGRV